MGKKILILALISAVAFSGYAQKKAKASKALNYFKKNELNLAQDEIDRAIQDEKQAADGKTWYYRGLIYCALDTTTNADFQALAEDPLVTAVESFDKAEELTKGKEYYIPDENGFPLLKSQQIDYLWSAYLNNGAAAYNEQDYENAMVEFGKGAMLKPQDTTAYLYAGTVAAMSDNNDAALEYFYKAKDLGITDKDVYGSLINLERSHNKDTAAALAVVREAIEKFEDNDSFKKEEINILITTNQVEPAKEKIQENIDSDPNNETLYYSLGFLLDQTGDAEGAVEAYKKALEIKPDYFEANYNCGVYYYNKAIEKQKEINNLGITKADQAKAKEMKPQVVEYFKEAKPFFEGAMATNPDDQGVLETLELIYLQTGEREKSEEITKKLEAMGAGN